VRDICQHIFIIGINICPYSKSRNSDGLESNYYSRRSSDYAWQLFLAAGAILVSHPRFPSSSQSDRTKQALCYPLDTYVHTRPLLVALTYLSSQLSPPGTQSSIFGLITLPVVYYPYLMVGMDLVMGGPAAAASGVVGLVVGHGWWWGIYGGAGGRGSLESLGRAPAWVKNFVSDGPPDVAGAGGAANAGEGAADPGPIGGVHVITPRSRTTGSSSSSTTTGYQWGSGQRLGDS
jgi:Derlin-2/3